MSDDFTIEIEREGDRVRVVERSQVGGHVVGYTLEEANKVRGAWAAIDLTPAPRSPAVSDGIAIVCGVGASPEPSIAHQYFPVRLRDKPSDDALLAKAEQADKFWPPNLGQELTLRQEIEALASERNELRERVKHEVEQRNLRHDAYLQATAQVKQLCQAVNIACIGHDQGITVAQAIEGIRYIGAGDQRHDAYVAAVCTASTLLCPECRSAFDVAVTDQLAHEGHASPTQAAPDAASSQPPTYWDTGTNAATAAQRAPTGNGVPITPLVIADLEERSRVGAAKYGTPLRAHNGRDALVDSYQEALDLVQYLRQLLEERQTA